MTGIADDNVRLYPSGARETGTVAEGGGGPGPLALLDGTGRFAGVQGSCTCGTACLEKKRNLTTMDGAWSKE